MAQTLMPKATAVWLIDNTTLTFEQIADFCGLHVLEVQAIADGEVASNIVGEDPLQNGQLTQAELDRCQKDSKSKLKGSKRDTPEIKSKVKGPKYTPILKRADKPDGIAWIIKHHPNMPDSMICKLIGTTKPTIASIRSRKHWNSQNISPRNPVQIGLCHLHELQTAISKYEAKLAKQADKKEAEEEKA